MSRPCPATRRQGRVPLIRRRRHRVRRAVRAAPALPFVQHDAEHRQADQLCPDEDDDPDDRRRFLVRLYYIVGKESIKQSWMRCMRLLL